MPLKASSDINRCVGPAGPTSTTPANAALRSAMDEPIEDIYRCCRLGAGITSPRQVSPPYLKPVLSRCLFNFWTRATTPGQAQAQLAAQTVAQLLHGLHTHPSTRAALAEKGIAHLQPQGPASVMPSVDYAERLLICAAQLQYPVIQTDAAADLPTPR